MITIEDAFVVFGAGTSLERVALRGVSFSIQEGEVVSILGNNGSGRSTLLKFLAGHIPLNFGRLWLDNMDITTQSLLERSHMFSSVFYDSSDCTADNLTVLENLVVASLHHRDRSLIKAAIDDSDRDKFYEYLKNLNFMKMENLLDEKVRDIPKPYRQVLALIIAVIKGSKVLLIDEHSTGLDIESSQALLNATYKIIKSKKMTTIMVVSDAEFALEKSDRVMVLNYGQIVASYSGEEKKNLKLEDLFMAFNRIPEFYTRKLPINV